MGQTLEFNYYLVHLEIFASIRSASFSASSVFRIFGQFSTLSSVIITTLFVVPKNRIIVVANLIGDHPVTAFAEAFSLAFSNKFSVSAAKPITSLGRFLLVEDS